MLEPRTLLAGQAVSLIQDVNPVESYPSQITPAGTNLFSVVPNGAGQQLVVTNALGTTVLQDFGPGATGSGTSSGTLGRPTPVGNSLFFLDGSTGADLWTSDGTNAGTAPVSLPNGSTSYIGDLAAVGNTLIVSTNSYASAAQDDQLWAVSPGDTSASLIADFQADAVSIIGTIGGTAYLSVGGNLWTTDGTAAHTIEWKDAASHPIPAPGAVFAFQGQVLYFSPGTTSSTIGVLGGGGETPTITGLPASASAPYVAGSSFYFTAADSAALSAANTVLWASDGTPSGTRSVEDFRPISPAAVPSNLVAVNGSLFFTIAGSDGLAQLWSSGGTAQGTTLVKDLGVLPTASSSYYGPASPGGVLTPIGGTLYFTAADSAHGAELWSDAVATGTVQLVADISPGPASSDPRSLVAFGGRLYFSANDGSSPLTAQLWSSGGTAATTSRAASFPGQDAGSAASLGVGQYATLGPQILMALDDGIHGPALWATDGTAPGTRLLSAVDPIAFAVLDGTAFFLGTGGGSSLGLWQTDGTASGTIEVRDLSTYGLVAASQGRGPEIVVSGPHLFFTTTDGSGGVDLWSSLGTSASTSIVRDFAPTTAAAYGSTTARLLTPFAGQVAFVADTGTLGPQVWISDGTAVGTQALTDLPNASGTSGSPASVDSLTVAGGRLDFVSTVPGVSSGFWSTDGTPGHATEFLLPNRASTNPAQPVLVPAATDLTSVGSGLFFALDYGGTSGAPAVSQLWTTIGASGGAGAVPLQAGDGSEFSRLSNFMALGNDLLFESQSASGAEELWSSDGTSSGTTALKVINPNASGYGDTAYNPGVPLVSNGIVYFAADNGTNGVELWQSDGTPAGTFMVADINPGAAGSNPMPLGVASGGLVVAADDGIHGAEPMLVVPTATTAPPQLAVIPTQYATVGQAFQLNLALVASDPNNPVLPLTYSLGADAPAGMTLDPNSGLLSWPGSSNLATGTLSFTVTVTDNGSPAQSASEAITLDVLAVQPPVLQSIPTQDIGVGHTVRLDVSAFASDPNLPPFPLTYSLTNAPAGAAIDPQTGMLTWPTGSNQATGTYAFTVAVSDDSTPSLVATETFQVQVNPVSPPVISTIPGQSANAGTTFALDLGSYASDPNLPVLPMTFALGPGAPAGASIDRTTGFFTWTIPADQATGPQSFTLIASDNSTPANTATQAFTVTVFPSNAPRPPVLATLPSISVTAGETLTTDLSRYASDPNAPPLPLTYALGADAPTYASIDPTTGVLTISPPANQATGPITFTVIVADNQAAPQAVSGPITVNVLALQPPSIAAIPAQSATIGEPFAIDLGVHAVDPNNPPLPLTFSLGTGAPADAVLNPSTGVFSWTPTTADGTGAHTIPFTVSDGTATGQAVSGSFIVNVLPSTVQPPAFRPIPTQSVTIGETLTLDAGSYASDPNTPARPLTFSLAATPAPPPGLSIDPTTGVVTWTTTSGVTAQSYSIAIVATDNASPPNAASTAVTLIALAVRPPTVQSGIPTQTLAAGQALKLDLSPYAADQNTPALPLAYSLVANTLAGLTLDPTTGLLQWTVPASQAAGPLMIAFAVSDRLSAANPAQGRLTVIVSPDLAPVVQSIPTAIAPVGRALAINLASYASDPNTPAQALTYALASGSPAGAQLNASTGAFTWTPPTNQPPVPVTIAFRVTNAAGLVTSGSFVVDVLVPPLLRPIPAQAVTAGQTVVLNISPFATDPNSPALPLTYSLTPGAPSGASIDPTTGLFTWTPPASQPGGATTITVVVTDNESPPQTAASAVTINVTPIAIAPPVLRAISQAATADVGQAFTLDVGPLASDPNSPPRPLTFSLAPGAPSGMSIDPTIGVLTWNVPATQRIGAYSATVIVANNATPASSASETFTVAVVDPSPPPTVGTPTIVTKKGYTITVTFTQPVDPATAGNPGNYLLTQARKPKSRRKPAPPAQAIGLSVRFNPAANQVVLHAARKPRAGMIVTLTIVGSGPNGIAKLTGLQLAGNGSQPGMNYVATISGKRITPVAAVARAVVSVRAQPHLKRTPAASVPAGPAALFLGVIPGHRHLRTQ